MIRTNLGSAEKSVSTASPAASVPGSEGLVSDIVHWLDDAKAENIETIPLKGKSSIGDYMIVASGRTDRHVGAIAEQLRDKIKASGHREARVEGMKNCDWVLIDTGDIIVHVFRPEVREFYNIEKMWKSHLPESGGGPTETSQH